MVVGAKVRRLGVRAGCDDGQGPGADWGMGPVRIGDGARPQLSSVADSWAARRSASLLEPPDPRGEPWSPALTAQSAAGRTRKARLDCGQESPPTRPAASPGSDCRGAVRPELRSGGRPRAGSARLGMTTSGVILRGSPPWGRPCHCLQGDPPTRALRPPGPRLGDPHRGGVDAVQGPSRDGVSSLSAGAPTTFHGPAPPPGSPLAGQLSPGGVPSARPPCPVSQGDQGVAGRRVLWVGVSWTSTGESGRLRPDAGWRRS